MNKKRLQSYISTSVIISTIINFILMLIIGTKEKEIYNYILSGVVSVITATITSFLLYRNTHNINTYTIIKNLLINVVASFMMGYLIEMLIIDKLLNKDICNIIRIVNAIYQTVLGILVGINISYGNYLIVINKK